MIVAGTRRTAVLLCYTVATVATTSDAFAFTTSSRNHQSPLAAAAAAACLHERRHRIPPYRFHERRSSTSSSFLRQSSSSSSSPSPSSSFLVEKDQELLATIQAMRVKELKAELSQRNISSANAFEKEELVKRLYDARISSPSPPVPPVPTAAAAAASSADVIRGDLSFTSSETGRSIPGTDNSQSIRIEAEGDPYPTMTIQVLAADNNNNFELNLLVDTACSGFVLRPSTVQNHKDTLRSLSTPVTMTGAGGTTSGGTTGLTQVDAFTFGEHYCSSAAATGGKKLGPLPAAVQDIGALPLGLDGIIGLSFLNQYACTELDLGNSNIAFYKTEYRPPYDDSLLHIVAEGELSPTRLGIWTVETMFDGRGPIKMLVDTGATSTFLSWKGLQQLGLSRDSPLVQELTQQMGAMGADNVAMRLTHRLEVGTSVQLGQRRRRGGKYEGLPIGNNNNNNSPSHNNKEVKPLSIDIGDIAILDTQLAADNVAGIMGMDVFSQCSVMRMTFNGPVPRITLLNQRQRQQQQQQKKKKHTSNNNSNSNTNTNNSRNENNSNNENTIDDSNLNSNPNPNSARKATSAAAKTTSATTSPLFKKQQQQQKQYERSDSDSDSDEKTMSSMEEEQKKPRKKKKKRRP